MPTRSTPLPSRAPQARSRRPDRSRLSAGLAGLALTLTTVSVGCRHKMAREYPEPAEPEQLVPPASETRDDEDELEERASDADITEAVERELLLDHLTPALDIEVATVDGIVELTGTVDNLLAKTRATRIAELVKGVRTVSNRIEVEAEGIADAKLRADVESTLLYDPAAESYEVDVAVKDGAVTLTGTVDSWAEAQLVERVVASVRGVEAIDNRVTIDYASERRDEVEIEPEVEARLAYDVLVDERLIDVRVDDGVVKLSGVVGSAAERSRARALAQVAGVESVDVEDLRVNWLRADTDLRDSTAQLPSNEEIRDAIEDAALLDPRVASFEIRPVVHGPTVTLYGTVDNLAAKQAAEQLARNTVGVAAVINKIEVLPPPDLSDEKIAEALRGQLLTNIYTDLHEIHIEVEDGHVTLTGTVDTYFEKAEATDVAQHARGVVLVTNLLQVEDPTIGFFFDPYLYPYHPYIDNGHTYAPPTTAATDADIEAAVERQLYWSPYVDDRAVKVQVEEGEASLTGTVGSWRERAAATQAAYEAGALFVENMLHVDAG